MYNSFWEHPIATIEKALDIRKQIEALQESLSAIYSGAAGRVSSVTAKVGKSVKPAKRGRPRKADKGVSVEKAVDGRKGKRSAAARAKMAAAQKARWARNRTSSTTAAPAETPAKAGRKRKIMSPEARAKIAAAQRARWARQKTA
jgi:transcription termination factor Rho